MKLKLKSRVLYDIVNNTPNPSIAMKLIDGTYRKPKMAKSVIIGEENVIATLVMFDKWTNQVIYSVPGCSNERMSLKEWMNCNKQLIETSAEDIRIMEGMAEEQMAQE